jgi:hypothetical protein
MSKSELVLASHGIRTALTTLERQPAALADITANRARDEAITAIANAVLKIIDEFPENAST